MRRSKKTARAATSEWGSFPTATLKSTKSYTSRGTFSAPMTINRSSRGMRESTSSIGRPYIVRWTFGPCHSRKVCRQGTPVSIRNEPPNRRTTLRTVRSSAGSRVETRTPSAPKTRAVKATWVVTRLSRAGRCPSRSTVINGQSSNRMIR